MLGPAVTQISFSKTSCAQKVDYLAKGVKISLLGWGHTALKSNHRCKQSRSSCWQTCANLYDHHIMDGIFHAKI